jgi:hypothetical protein
MNQEEDEEEWIQCTSCEKWRRLPEYDSSEVPRKYWECHMNDWDTRYAACDAPDEEDEDYDAACAKNQESPGSSHSSSSDVSSDETSAHEHDGNSNLDTLIGTLCKYAEFMKSAIGIVDGDDETNPSLDTTDFLKEFAAQTFNANVVVKDQALDPNIRPVMCTIIPRELLEFIDKPTNNNPTLYTAHTLKLILLENHRADKAQKHLLNLVAGLK